MMWVAGFGISRLRLEALQVAVGDDAAQFAEPFQIFS